MLPLIIYVFQIVPMSSCRIILNWINCKKMRKVKTRLGQRLKELPAYMDKAARVGIRIADLLDKEILRNVCKLT